jgi:hypothetical protein
LSTNGVAVLSNFFNWCFLLMFRKSAKSCRFVPSHPERRGCDHSRLSSTGNEGWSENEIRQSESITLGHETIRNEMRWKWKWPQQKIHVRLQWVFVRASLFQPCWALMLGTHDEH